MAGERHQVLLTALCTVSVGFGPWDSPQFSTGVLAISPAARRQRAINDTRDRIRADFAASFDARFRVTSVNRDAVVAILSDREFQPWPDRAEAHCLTVVGGNATVFLAVVCPPSAGSFFTQLVALSAAQGGNDYSGPVQS